MKINGTIFSKPQQDQLKRAMAATKNIQYTLDLRTNQGCNKLLELCNKVANGAKVTIIREINGTNQIYQVGSCSSTEASLYNSRQYVGSGNPIYLAILTVSKNSTHEYTVMFKTDSKDIVIGERIAVNETVTAFVEE